MKIKINESKILEFEMNTSGVSWEALQGFFRINFKNIEYGFPVKISEGIAKIEIPVFKDILNEHDKKLLYENKEISVKARLDLIANNEVYISPWSGEIDIEIPVSIKVNEEKIVDKSKKSKKITVTDIKEYAEDNPLEKIEEKKENKKSKFFKLLN